MIRGGDPLTDRRDAELVALEEERDLALEALRRLERERGTGELDDASYQGLRDEQTARAAAAIRALDAWHAARAGEDMPSPPAETGDAELPGGEGETAPRGGPATQRAHAPSRKRQRLLAAGAIVAFVAAAGVLVGHYAADRLPGQEVSGSITSPTAPRLQKKQLAERLVQGRLLASQGKDVQASKIFSQVLKSYPNQPEALAYEGWLLRKAGVADHDTKLEDQGRAKVAQAIAVDPTYPDAHVFLGYMFFQDEHDPVDAVAQFGLFLQDHPTQALVQRAAPTIAAAYRAAHQAVPAEVTTALAKAPATSTTVHG